MICIMKELVQCFSLFVIIMMNLVSTIDAKQMPVLSVASVQSYKMAAEYDFGSEDERLIADILVVMTRLYTGLIDVSALYFSGIILDQDQLLERVMFEIGKESFQIVKLLALYGPRMLQNPKITLTEKLKKTTYIVSFLVVCWAIVAHERSCYMSKLKASYHSSSVMLFDQP